MKDLKQKLSSFSLEKFLTKNWPLWVILLAVVVFFWKVFFKDMVPLPADFMVGTYYPWLDYKWGYAVGVPVKNPITTDVVSFSYPMRILAIDLMRDGVWPLWNRFILGGIPLLANFQSAPFTFTNFFYVFFDNINGWSLQVMSQHFFAMLFMYILLRYWRVSRMASLIGGLIYAFAGFNMIWSQWNSHTLTAAFIPMIIFLINKFIDSGAVIWCVFLSIAVALQIFTGYPQAVFYTVLVIIIYLLFKFNNDIDFYKHLILLAIFGVAGILLTAPQLLPAYELLEFSQRAVEPLEFDWAFLPWIKSITIFAPDFFGNHATKNYWGPGDYTMNTGYIGVVAGVLALISLIKSYKTENKVRFAGLIVFLSLILSFPTPLSIFIWRSGLFGLQAASAHRAMVIFIFGISILAAFGTDLLVKDHGPQKYISVIIPGIILSVYSLSTLLANFGNGTATLLLDFEAKANVLVSLRNLVLPWVFLFLIGSLIFISKKIPKRIVHISVFILIMAELFRFGWKYTPFSPKRLVYPETSVISYLKDQKEPFRVSGADVIPINMRMQYRLESLEGYDAIYPVKIAKFIAILNSENIHATPQGRYGTVSNKNSHLLDLTNTKYILNIEKEEIETTQFLDTKFTEVFRDRSVAIYENENVLPRAFIAGSWEYQDQDEQVLGKLLEDDLRFNEKIIISGTGEDFDQDKLESNAEYLKYTDTESLIKVKSSSEGYLFISDLFYPGWKAYIDGVQAEIERANFTFRAVKVPKGEHDVRMIYEPESFTTGINISILIAGALFLVGAITFVNKTTVSYTNHSRS